MKAVLLLLAISAAAVVVRAQEDYLDTARQQYAAAAYEEALSALIQVGSDAPEPVLREAEAYRAFSLVALGRTAEAQSIAETLLRADPMLRVDSYPDTSPRIESMFAEVRTRVLPQLIRNEYQAARALATAKAPDAEPRLRHVREMLAQAQAIGVWDDTLADLRILVDGFLQLSQLSAPAPAVQLPAPTRGLTADAPGVIPPVALSQPPPQLPASLVALIKSLQPTGTFDILIDEHGLVDDVIVKRSVTSAYDALLVAAARKWKYKPAMQDGVPVRFIKTLNVKAQ
jgi:TonB family protein